MHAVGTRCRRLVAVVAGTVLTTACLVAGSTVFATADTTPQAGTPATVSADGLPTWQLNGVVWSQVVVGNTVYATGRFSQARPPGVVAGGRGTVPARNIFAYDIRTGNRVASFHHSLNAQGLALTRSPDGKRVYVVGDFTRVDSHKRSHVAAFDTASSALDRAFVPTISASAAAVTASNHKVWIGGNFFNANGSARWRLAAFRAGNGRLLSWAPRANDEQVTSMVLAPGGSRVIIGGRFSTVNGHRAPAMASVDSVTGALRPWAINTRINDAGHSSGITSLSTDGTSIFGTGFAYGTGNFEGTFSAKPNTGAPNWVNDCHGDTYAAAPIGRVLYTVSHAHDCEWIGAFPRGPEEWVNQRRALAFSTASSGRTGTGPDSYGWNYAGLPVSSLLHWFPVLSPGTFTGQHQAAWSVAGNRDYVALGGEFRSVNGIAQSDLVRFAVRAKAPNRQAPVWAPSAPRPTAELLADGTVRVSWQAAYDLDNASLTYQVFRSGTTDPVYTTRAISNFWTYPMLAFHDTVPSGSYTYRIEVSDSSGRAPKPATAVVTVP